MPAESPDPGTGPVVVRDNAAESRYEVYSGETLAGFAQYKLNPGRIAFVHTETDPEFSGRGLARRLVAEALDDAHRRGLAVLPFCPYVKKVVSGSLSYRNLVPAEQRERFGL